MLFGSARDALHSVCHLTPNKYPVDALGMILVPMERLGESGEINLRGSHLRLLAIAVHGDQITGEPRQFVVPIAEDKNVFGGESESKASLLGACDRAAKPL